jgi:PKD repeat protein
VIDQYASNPFTDLPGSFGFLHDGSINDNQLVNMQYYYDLFSDLLLAYEELRRKGLEMLSLCCPDSELFPRHLLLGFALNDGKNISQQYRQYFIPSPIFQKYSHLIVELRWLFTRMVLMVEKFNVPPVVMNNTIKRISDANIRITPSKFGDVALSERSIPYYYKVNDATGRLYEHWSVERSRTNTANRNLSYHAKEYNNTDEFVLKPLLYDLEPCNFLRIEGHIGKPYAHAVKNILSIRNANRLPFEVIALSADIKNIRQQLAMVLSGNLAQLNQLRSTIEPSQCHFQDLESLYDTLAAELICILCKELQYYYGFPGSNANLPIPNSLVPQVSLLKRCAPNFRFVANSLGHEFEIFYNNIKNQPYVSADVWLQNFSNPTLATNQTTGNVGFAIMYYIVKLSEVVSDNLSSFDVAEFVRRYDDLVKVAEFIKKLLAGIKFGDNNSNLIIFEDIFDHLDAIIYACKKAAFEALVKEYRLRWIYVLVLQRFGYFIKLHPGIQHKAGVPVGGTFIVVYHEEEQELERVNLTTGFNANQQTFTRTAATNNDRVNEPANNPFTSSNAGNAAQSNLTGNISDQFQQANIRGFNTIQQQQALQQLFVAKAASNATIDDVISDIADGTVIADFYLPYICCSDCPPMQFVINERPQEEKPTIAIDATEYCNDDKTAYQVAVSPEGGVLSGEGTQSNANGNSFNPTGVNLAGSASKKVILSYKVGAEEASIEVTVFQKPTADYTFTVGAAGAALTLVTFASTSKFAKSFAWDFGDGTSSTEEKPVHDFKKTGTFKVTLKVTNGPCSASTAKDVTIKEQEQLSININPDEFCSDDKKSYEIVVSPVGGTVSGDGTGTSGGKSLFKPATVNFEGKNVDVVISYKKDGQEASTNVMVFRKPSAAFQFSPATSSPLSIQFFNASQFAESFEWSFGDDEKSSEEKPVHTYKKAGDYNVILTATNGVCSSAVEQVVSIKEQSKKTCLPAASLVSDFNNLQSVDSGNFAAFTKNFNAYKEIATFFKTFASIADDTPEKHFDFFSQAMFTDAASGGKIPLAQAMMQWLDTLLNQFIKEQESLRLLALTMYRIIANLALYIECIQQEDIGKAKIDVGGVLSLIVRHLNSISQIAGNFSKAQRAVLSQLLQDCKDEATRVKNNKEESTKAAYLKKLNEMISILTTLNF